MSDNVFSVEDFLLSVTLQSAIKCCCVVSPKMIPAAFVTVLLATSTVTQWQLQSRVRISSALSHGRHTNDYRNIEGALHLFWNDHPFKLANGIVRNVLATGNATSRLVQTTEVDTNSNAFFSNLYEGKVLSSVDFLITDVHRRRKKQSFCLVLAYDGYHFCGWQRQPKNLKSPSVQEVIENAIESAFVENGRPDVRVSGRTDSGVHALGQIARVRILTQCTANNSKFVVTTNDVFDVLNVAAQKSNYTWRCLSVYPVSDKFHPTFDAISRSYAYILDVSAVEELIDAILSTEVKVSKYRLLVRFEKHLNSLLKCLIDKELDYYALSYGSVKTESTLCRIEHAKVVIGKAIQSQKIDQPILLFEFTGNRFLRRMVRILVGTCIYHALIRLASTPWINIELDYQLDGDTELLDICNMRERSNIVKVAPPDGLIFLGANVTKR